MQNETSALKLLGVPQLNETQMVLEISKRINCARRWCRKHWILLSNNELTSKAKFLNYKLFVRSLLTYGCEVWNLDNRCCKKLIRFEYSILLEIYKSKYPQRHPKRLRASVQTVYGSYKDTDVVDYVQNQCLKWDTLLLCEESALRSRCPTIQWWDGVQ